MLKTSAASQRPHAQRECHCRECKEFDYAQTALILRHVLRREYLQTPTYEVLTAIDSETGERVNYLWPL